MRVQIAVVGPNEEHFDDDEADGHADVLLEREHAVSVFVAGVAPGQPQDDVDEGQEGIELWLRGTMVRSALAKPLAAGFVSVKTHADLGVFCSGQVAFEDVLKVDDARVGDLSKRID